MKAFFDSNILIDFLKGFEEAKVEIERHRIRQISRISWMEVLVGAVRHQTGESASSTESATRAFLDSFECVELDRAVADRAVELRQRFKLRLPDAIIWASAQVEDAVLVTRNTRDFPEAAVDVRVPYRR